MEQQELSAFEVSFNQLIDTLVEKRKESEQFTAKLNGERTQFTRFNHAKVRQTGCVVDGSVELTLSEDQRSSSRQFPFTGNWEVDWEVAQTALQELRAELPQLPVDPYLVLPTGTNTSREIHSGKLLTAEILVPTVLELLGELDFTGLYAGGVVIQGYGDSNQQKHWFTTDSFTLDYSLFTPEGQALKGIFAGSDWNHEAYIDQINDAKKQLKLLSCPTKELPRGQYKTYFEPAAVADLLSMLSWGGLSEADLQQGNSALALLSRKEKQLSHKFSLKENFQRGLIPRFNEWGEIAELELGLIEKGVIVNTLINSRTAKEYQKKATGANGYESLRAPEVTPGSLEFAQILTSLDTGLYVSNLHYLNWSDRPTGRITGMTRYACFWVEDGEIVAPIENLRFDESLYRFWGENLVDLTDFQEFIPEVGTYERRHLGGSMVPGMLVEDFTYTL
ncbi:metallopeptidase TldD-related protein [Aetokthonos hydrillicola Thurmond2011]|jgi:predicted Zn-dependent protease|uniref:Metallopeptidase TldD-related protein n=1 Tax=Aetokthonos hydrillicola Thurmond2011 TaxID=2712845 RepID=A0AAP5M6S8_9CYAN|nr:metallopeptidase TldD-related protein [Aetokthonos hydrillicola]MBO3459321.1 TldD/PmbA family protein [Aetokthonos hydrillicola CCALA 1050]MBW4587748.1 TldD/PmbA family protein [Aetokthonos hydrillicola CCALA 1050]MDR9894395.1 metallopeptidase TldD-related protein [Aetokthonos hydrillicola Thurmond2011]